jgi:hypothetical protein
MIARTLLTAVFITTLGAGLLSAGSPLPYKIVIDREGPEEAAFEKITAALVEAKVEDALARAALKGFDRYIDRRIEKDKKSVTLYPQTIFEVARTAATKAWPAGQIGDLLSHIQREIDEENGSGTKLKRLAVAEIEKGKKLHDVIQALEQNEGDDDDDKR